MLNNDCLFVDKNSVEMCVLQNIKAIVFDIDGTIMDSIGRIVECLQDSCAQYGIEKPSTEDCKNVIGLTLPEAIATLISNESQETIDKVEEFYRVEYVRKEELKPTSLFDGVEELFKNLKEQGFKIAIATGKSRKGYNRVIQNTPLEQYIDVSVTGDEVRSKPDPQMLVRISDILMLPYKAILMVGDSLLDLEMAKKISMPSAGVLTGVHDSDILNTANPLLIEYDVKSLGKKILLAKKISN